MEQKATDSQQKRFKNRTLSRTILGSDLDLINKYASKYGSSTNIAFNNPTKYYTKSFTANNIYNYNNTSSNNIHKKQPSLITTNNDALFNKNELISREQQMQQAMTNMLGSYNDKIMKHQNIVDEINYEKKINPEFGNIKNSDDWTNLEVCNWLIKIHLDKYLKNFMDQTIDGSILLRDLNENILKTELGVKALHVKKFQREIQKLREASPKFQEAQAKQDDKVLIKTLTMEVETLQNENVNLKNQIDSLKKQIQAQNSIAKYSSTFNAKPKAYNSYRTNKY